METEGGVANDVDKEQPALLALAQHQQAKDLPCSSRHGENGRHRNHGVDTEILPKIGVGIVLICIRPPL